MCCKLLFLFAYVIPLYMQRVIKEALCSSGANITEKHIMDVSMSALFLMEAARKCDKVFGTTPLNSSYDTQFKM